MKPGIRLFILTHYALATWALWVPTLLQAQSSPTSQVRRSSPEKGIPLLELNNDLRQYTLGTHLEILEDPQSTLTLPQVVSAEFDPLFRPSTQDIPNFGYSRSDFWFRLRVKNAAIRPDTHWLLEVAHPMIDQIELYIFYADGTYQVKRGGDRYAFDQREIKFQNPAFDLGLGDAQIRTLYIHASGNTSKQFPFYIWESLHFFEQMHQQNMLWGIYFGALLVMLLYNLFLFISIRNLNYLYYVLYIGGFTLVQMSLTGFAYQFLWPDQPTVANISPIVFIGFTLCFGMTFSISLLNIREMLPKAFPLMVGLAVLSLVFSVLAMADLLEFPIRFSALLSLLCSVTLFVVGLMVLRKGYRPARFYMIAWTALLLGLVLYVSKNAGLLPSTFITEHAIQIGSVMELILLSLGLGDSMNCMKKEQEKAQLAVIGALKENERIKDAINQKLEQRVQQRTCEIVKQKEELEVLNATKDKFFSIVAHDLKGPLNSMTGFFDLLANHTAVLSLEEIQAIARNLSESIENTTRLTDNLLTWAMAQMNTLKHQPRKIKLDEIIQDGVAFFKESSQKKQIQLRLDIQPDLYIFADENHIHFVLRNLISNALKFTRPGGAIAVSAQARNGRVEIAVADNGVGMSDEVLNKIFRIDSKHTTDGTAGEKGTGLGLLLCKEFVERNQGRLWAKSEFGKGSTFCFAFQVLTEEKDLV